MGLMSPACRSRGMSERPDAPAVETTARAYHHGNLIDTACEVGERLIVDGGLDKLSMRSVAAQVGVAHRALYRHFTDRDAFLNAIAARIYQRLASSLEAATANTGDPRRRFVETYVSFAMEDGHSYDLILSRNAQQIADTIVLQKATQSVIAISLNVFGGTGSGPHRRDRVIAIWSMIHGAIMLSRSGIIRMRDHEALSDYLMHLLDLGTSEH